MSANRTKSSRSSSGNIFPVLLLGALGVGIAYYFYQNSESSFGSGSSSGSLYDIIGGAATNSDPALSPAAAAAGMGAGSASVIGTGLSSSSSGSSSGSSYVAEVGKKAATVQEYQAIDANFVNSINSQLMNIYGEGSAYNFVKVPSNAAAAATIQNTGINNAGKELLSIVNSDYSYQVYDSRGQIVSSGSAGAFQGNVILNTGSSRSSSGSSGSSSSGSSVSSKKSLSVSSSGSSKETVAITADKAAAHSAGVYSDKISGTATIGYKKSSSSGSSGSSSSGKKYTH